jgi:parallel beta-helix repeat protein
MKSFTCVWLALTSLAFGAAASATEHIVHDGESIQSAVNKAQPGDSILVMPGSYHETVFIDKDRIYLHGAVKGDRWPVLDGNDELHDGILVSGHGVTVERMYVRRFRGNGIMTQGGNNFRIIRNRVEGRGFYGIFPQFGKNGLVAYNTVWNVEDAGIYLGMCENIDILSNESFQNIIGIEAENSSNTLVQNNYLHDNTSGLLVSLFQGLAVKTSTNNIVRGNFIINNNTTNFAPPGSVSNGIPPGIGIFIFASNGSTIENNLIRDNETAGVFVADQSFIPGPPDPKEDPRPNEHRILDNIFIDNGAKPQGSVGSMLAALSQTHGPDTLTTIGAESWTTCEPGATSKAILTQQLSAPLPSANLTERQKGRLTYLAVCSGCHSYSMRLIGPPMVTVQALYKGKPEALAAWIAAPTKKRPDFAEMPPQNYLPEDVRLAVAKYILEDLHP